MKIFRQLFPVLYVLPFLFASTQLPLISSLGSMARWPVLIIGMGFAARFGFNRFGLGKKQRRSRILFADVFIITFLTIFLLSCLWSISPIYSFQKVISQTLLYICAFWTLWIYADKYSEERLLKKALNTIVVVMGANLLISWFIADPFLSGRFRGFFVNPNNIGILTAVAVPLVFLRWFEFRRQSDVIALIILGANLVLSGSRSALMSFAIVVLLVIIGKLLSRPKKVFFPAFLLVIGLVALSQTNFFYDRILRLDTLETASNRTFFWALAKDYIALHPLLGHGFGADIIIHDYYGVVLTDLALRGNAVMSSYFGLVVQIGKPLSYVFFSLLWVSILFILLTKRRDYWIFGYAAILSAGLTLSIFEPILFSSGNMFSFIYWLVAMLLVRRLSLHGHLKRENKPIGTAMPVKF